MSKGSQEQLEEKLEFENPLFFLDMNEMQERFIRIRNKGGGTPKRRLLEAGNKSGKTEIGIIEDLSHVFGKRYWLNEDDPNYRVPIRIPNQGLIGCETLSQSVMQKIWPTIQRLIPKTCQYKEKKNPMGQVGEIRFFTDPEGNKCGSKLFIRSYDQEAKTFEGIDYDWIHWDEPPPKDVVRAAERGKITSNAPSWFTMTPLREPYIYDEYSLKAFNNGGDDDEIAIIRGEIWDNCSNYCYKCKINIPENNVSREMSQCPKCEKILGFITKAGINEYLKTLDPEEREAREKGLWKHLSGLVYKELDRDLHLYDDFPIPKGWMKIEGIDPHDSKPTKYLFGAVSPEEIEIEGKVKHRIYFYDYLLSSKENIDTFVRRIKMTREKHGYSRPKWIMLDSKYGTRTELEGRTWEGELRNRGLGYIRLSQSKPGDVELGHKIVREYLKSYYLALKGTSKPGLMFAKQGCSGQHGPIHQMLNYQYKPEADKPEEEYKDYPDIVRYICMEQPVFVSPESERTIIEMLDKRKNMIYEVRRRAVI